MATLHQHFPSERRGLSSSPSSVPRLPSRERALKSFVMPAVTSELCKFVLFPFLYNEQDKSRDLWKIDPEEGKALIKAVSQRDNSPAREMGVGAGNKNLTYGEVFPNSVKRHVLDSMCRPDSDFSDHAAAAAAAAAASSTPSRRRNPSDVDTGSSGGSSVSRQERNRGGFGGKKTPISRRKSQVLLAAEEEEEVPAAEGFAVIGGAVAGGSERGSTGASSPSKKLGSVPVSASSSAVRLGGGTLAVAATAFDREDDRRSSSSSNSSSSSSSSSFTSSSAAAASASSAAAHSVREDDVFYDLGSGTGKIPLQIALQSKVRRAVGIEFAAMRHTLAEQAYARLSSGTKQERVTKLRGLIIAALPPNDSDEQDEAAGGGAGGSGKPPGGGSRKQTSSSASFSDEENRVCDNWLGGIFTTQPPSLAEIDAVAEGCHEVLLESSTRVEAILHDFLAYDFSDATLVYVNNTVFEPTLMIPLLAKLAALPKIRRLVTLRPLCTRHSARCVSTGAACSTFVYPPIQGICNPTWDDETTLYTYTKLASTGGGANGPLAATAVGPLVALPSPGRSRVSSSTAAAGEGGGSSASSSSSSSSAAGAPLTSKAGGEEGEDASGSKEAGSQVQQKSIAMLPGQRRARVPPLLAASDAISSGHGGGGGASSSSSSASDAAAGGSNQSASTSSTASTLPLPSPLVARASKSTPSTPQRSHGPTKAVGSKTPISTGKTADAMRLLSTLPDAAYGALLESSSASHGADFEEDASATEVPASEITLLSSSSSSMTSRQQKRMLPPQSPSSSSSRATRSSSVAATSAATARALAPTASPAAAPVTVIEATTANILSEPVTMRVLSSTMTSSSGSSGRVSSASAASSSSSSSSSRASPSAAKASPSAAAAPDAAMNVHQTPSRQRSLSVSSASSKMLDSPFYTQRRSPKHPTVAAAVELVLQEAHAAGSNAASSAASASSSQHAASADASPFSPAGKAYKGAGAAGGTSNSSSSSTSSSHHHSPAEVSSALTRSSEGREYDEFDDELREGDSWRSANSEAAASNGEEALNSRAFRMRASNLRYAISAAAQTGGTSNDKSGNSSSSSSSRNAKSAAETMPTVPQTKDASSALSLVAERRKAGLEAIQASKRKGAATEF